MNADEIMQKSRDAWNKKDKEAFLAYFTEHSELTGPGGLTLQGLAGVEMLWEAWRGAFPDNQVTSRNVFAAGDQVCGEGTFEGTHTGTLNGADGSQIPPTGRHVSLSSAEVNTIRDDKFVTMHIYLDQVELLTQLGRPPTPDSPHTRQA
ncbi:MAG: ester cyclase [Pseudonocardiaceae bacterium]